MPGGLNGRVPWADRRTRGCAGTADSSAAGRRNEGAAAVDEANGDSSLPARVLAGHRYQVFAVAFSPDGTRLASAGLDGTVRLWDVTAGTVLHVLRRHGEGATSVAFRPDGQQLATGAGDRAVRLWDPATGDRTAALRGHQ